MSTGAVLLGGMGAAVAVGWIIVPRVANQLAELRTALSDALRSLEQWLMRGPLDMAAGQIEQLRRGAVRTLPGGPAELASLGVQVPRWRLAWLPAWR